MQYYFGSRILIISASRRTDLPAFYTDWFMNRIREGYCLVPNPFNRKQISRVSLDPSDVDALVFWSKNPQPLLGHLAELSDRGYCYYFLFTLNNYPGALEANLPGLSARLEIFRNLSRVLGPERVVWRYDPIIISNLTSIDYHRRVFRELGLALAGRTRRVVISIVHCYAKTTRRLRRLESEGFRFDPDAARRPAMSDLLADLAGMARELDLEIMICAGEDDYSDLGILPGRCVDGALIRDLWGLTVDWPNDPGQRPACGCAVSKDIGVPDTCLHNCAYCYATISDKTARKRHETHQPLSPFLA